MLPVLRAILLGGLAALTGMFVYSIILRVGYPYELEWMTGSVLDHIERVRAGLPVYAPPTTNWIPYLYTPLYYWVSAAFTDSFLGCRVISIACALVQAICIHHLAKRGTGSRLWSLVAVGFFFACFAYAGDWYDLERPDTMCMAIVLVASVILVERRGVLGVVVAGLLLGLAFFAKQQASVFILAASVALLIERRWSHAAIFAAASFGLVAGVTAVLNARTAGWFGFYVFKMPAKHGIMLSLYRDLFRYDVPYGIVLFLATIALVVDVVVRRRRDDILFAALLAAGAGGALSSRLHIGGWINVLQVWTGFACVAVAVVATRIEAWLKTQSGPRATAGHAALYLVLIGQLVLWIHDPREARRLGDGRPFGETPTEMPNRFLAAGNAKFEEIVRGLEQSGEVLVVGRGHVTKQRHFQMAALADVIPMGGPPADLLDALTTHRLAAILDDSRLGGSADPLWPPVMMEDIAALRPVLFAHYFVSERIEDSVLRIPMPAPAAPRWVFLPRRHTLTLGEDALLKRHLAEVALAEERAAQLRAGKPEPFASRDIEELAAVERHITN